MDDINYNKRRRFSDEALLRGPNSDAAAALTSLVHSTLQNRAASAGNGAFMNTGTLSGFSRRPTMTELPLLDQLKSLLQDPAVASRSGDASDLTLRQAAVDLMVAAGQSGMGNAATAAPSPAAQNPDQFPQTSALLRFLTGSKNGGQASSSSQSNTSGTGTSYLTNELVRVQDFINQASYPAPAAAAPTNEVQSAITALMGLSGASSSNSNSNASASNATPTSSLLATWQATMGAGNGNGHQTSSMPAPASAPAPSAGTDLQSLLSSSCNGGGHNNSQALMDQYLQQLLKGANVNGNTSPAPTSAMIVPPPQDQNNNHLTQMVQKMLQQKQSSSAPAAMPSTSNNTLLMDQISALLKHSAAGGLGAAHVTPSMSPTSPLTEASGVVATTTKRKFSETLAQAVSSSATAGMTGKAPVPLYLSCDDERLSGYHALARKHIEFFEANQADTSSNARGRNRPIVLGQVGIRCKHCSHLAPRRRARAAMYYPFKLELLYQACQTLANVHLCEQCEHIPADVREQLVQLKGERTTALVGKKYWADGARRNGVFESEDGLRFHPSNKGEHN